jgi:F420 biosynthesis protein FbiB-like protein
MNGEAMLDLLGTRRSVRAFTAEPVPKPVLERLIAAAITAPSNTNRQPWRFAVVADPGLRKRLVDALRDRVDTMTAIVRRGHHAEDFGSYADFFVEPLEAAAAIVIPQYRVHPDLIANFIASGGGDPAEFDTATAMQAELCSTSAAVMAMLVQAHAEGLGACWMAGPMVARPQISAILGIRDPWKMVGAVAVGWPAETPPPKPRKPIDAVATWFLEGE